MALVGVPLAELIDPTGRFFYLAGGRSEDFVWRAYWWTLYAVSVLVCCVVVLGLNRRLREYQDRPSEPARRAHYEALWGLSFAAAAACGLILFVQTGLQHPAVMALRLGREEIAVLRITLKYTLNMNAYNLGVHLFGAFCLVVAGFFLRNWRLVAASVAMLLFLLPFSLAKSPLAELVIELAFIYLVFARPSWRLVPVLGALIVVALAAAAWFTAWVTDLQGFALFVALRVLWGQFADLPHYFNLFANDHLPFAALLPPYAQAVVGPPLPSAGRLVAEFANPEGVQLGYAGEASSFFIGEAFAFGGTAAVIMAPLLVALHYAFVTWLFGKLRKDAITVFVFGFLLNRMGAALFGGISSFVFSSLHIVLGAFLAFVLLHQAAARRRLVPAAP
jgi:hypothetical protein